MLSRSVLSFYKCGILLVGLDICGSDFNLVRCNICSFDLLVSLSVLFRTVRCVLFCVWALLRCFSRFDIRASGMAFFLFVRSYVFCCICLTTSGTSKSFSFSSLSRNFLLVLDVVIFDINNSALKSGKFNSFSISINISQLSSGVLVSVCFAPEKSRDLYVSFR